MKIKLATALVVTLGALALAANAQDNNPPAGGPPGPGGQPPGMREGGGPMGPRGFHLLPPRAAERLNLSDDQKKQIAALEAETKAKLKKILTADQLEQLKHMRPPMMMHGGPGAMNGPQGRPAFRPRWGGNRDNNMPPASPPPGNGDGNNPPPGSPPGGQSGDQ